MEINGTRFTGTTEWKTITLFRPKISEIIKVLTVGLQIYFEDVEVRYTKCPNLTEKPFNLTGNGLHGCETLIGCFTTVNETLQRNVTAKWNLKELAMQLCNDVFFIGGGYAGSPSLPFNGTLVMNATYSAPRKINNESCVVFKDTTSGRIKMETLKHPDHMVCSMKGNFFMSEGREGMVFELRVKKRKANPVRPHIDIIEIMRRSLVIANFTIDCDIGLGGILMVKKGSVTHHVLPDNAEVNQLVTPYIIHEFYQNIDSTINCPPFLVSLGTILVESNRNRHLLSYVPCNFYSFSHNENGGIFVDDIRHTDIVEYVGYFNIAKELYIPKCI